MCESCLFVGITMFLSFFPFGIEFLLKFIGKSPEDKDNGSPLPEINMMSKDSNGEQNSEDFPSGRN